MAKEKEVKVFERTVHVGTGKTSGKQYLFIKEGNTMVFVTLIDKKTNKRLVPKFENNNDLNVSFTSYIREAVEQENGRKLEKLTLFGVKVLK